MVKGILQSLNTSVRGLHQAAYLLAALTLTAQILALVRDRVFAFTFGASETLDLYYAAFRIPDLVFALVASLVSAYVLIPYLTKAGKKDTKELLSHTASFLLIFGGVISIVLYVFMKDVLLVLFPELMRSADSESFVFLARLLLLQPLLLGLSGMLSSVTQVHRRFMLFALSPVLYNLGIIIGAIGLYPIYGLFGVGLGVILGAVLHVFVHIPFILSEKVFPSLRIPSWKVMWPIVRESVPRSLALSLGAITTLALISIASRIEEGSIAVFTFASNLQAVPLALIGASYATAAFPVLSEEAHDKHKEAFKATLVTAARHLIFWSSVASVLIIVLRAHLVRTVLGAGAFDWDATRLTAALLAILVVGLAAQGITLLASRAFYASGRSWNPFFIQVFGIVASIAGALGLLSLSATTPEVAYFFEALLRIENIEGSSIVFVALGALTGQLLMGALALITLHRVAPGASRELVRPLFEGAGAGIVGGMCAYGALLLMGNIAPLTSFAAVFTQGLIAGIVGLIASGSVLILLENKEFKDVYEALKRLSSTRALKAHGVNLHDRTDT